MAVDVERTGSITTYETTADTVNHNFNADIPADCDYVLVFYVIRTGAGATTLTSLTVGGESCSLVADPGAAGGGATQIQVWRLVAPPTGASVAVAGVQSDMRNNNQTVTLHTIPFRNVDQVSPEKNATTDVGDSATPSVTVPSAVDEYVVALLGFSTNSSASFDSPATQLLSHATTQGSTGSNQHRAMAGTSNGQATNTTISATISTARAWAMAGLVLNAAEDLTGTETETLFDEAGHTVGQFPDGWTDRGFLTGGTVTVENITGFSEGRGLRMARTTNTHRNISWNLPGTVQDGRIRVLCRPTVERSDGGIGGEVTAYVTMRGQADDTYYRLQLRNANLLELVLIDGGTLTIPIGTGSATFNYALNDLIWLELEIIGNALRGRAWKDGDPIPSWMVEETDTNISAAGWAGVGRLHDGEVEWDQVKVTSFDPVIVDETTDESITLGDVAAEDILLGESIGEAAHLSELIIQDVTVGEVASEAVSLADLADDNATLDEIVSGSISLEAILTEDVIAGESTLVITIKFSGLV